MIVKVAENGDFMMAFTAAETNIGIAILESMVPKDEADAKAINRCIEKLRNSDFGPHTLN